MCQALKSSHSIFYINIYVYSRLWMAGLHQSAAGDIPMDRKLRILKYFLHSTPLEEDKVFLEGLIRDTTTRTSKIVTQWLQ